MPPGSTSVLDIDASADNKNDCLLLAATDRGVFVGSKPTSMVWNGWFTVAGGAFKAVTALNDQGTVVAAMIDTSGRVWRTGLGPAGWAVPAMIPPPPGVTAWRDIDMTWDEAVRGFMLAVPAPPDNKLWFMPMYGSQAWVQWRFFDTHLWAPGAGTAQDARRLISVTASRWMEDAPGVDSPVIFATDDQRNVYFIEFSRIKPGGAGWVLDWTSFYHGSTAYRGRPHRPRVVATMVRRSGRRAQSPLGPTVRRRLTAFCHSARRRWRSASVCVLSDSHRVTGKLDPTRYSRQQCCCGCTGAEAAARALGAAASAVAAAGGAVAVSDTTLSSARAPPSASASEARARMRTIWQCIE